jgi:hypothetical protein
MFVVMFFIGVLFNPMNMLAYRLSDIVPSLTLVYSGFLMASNMIWGHELVHYFTMGKLNWVVFFIGIVLSVFVVIVLLRGQLGVGPEQWMRRMIGHHSTALTTTSRLLNREQEQEYSPEVVKLARQILFTQENEILEMKKALGLRG